MEIRKTEFIQAVRDFLLVEKRDVSVKGFSDSKYAKSCIAASEILYKLQGDLAEHDSLGREILRSQVNIQKKIDGSIEIKSVWKK